MTPPALARPSELPSKIQVGSPSTVSTRGTRSRYAAGARLVKRSGASHQWESASTTNELSNIRVTILTPRDRGQDRRRMNTVEGRVAVVTGGGSGLGLGMAEAFAAAGMHLVLADIDAARLEPAVERVLATGARGALAVPTDVRDPESVVDLARRSVDAFGAVHVVCNNAGISAIGHQWQMSLDDWNAVLGVNLLGVVHGVHAFMPILLEQDEAHVVNTASMSGLVAS